MGRKGEHPRQRPRTAPAAPNTLQISPLGGAIKDTNILRRRWRRRNGFAELVLEVDVVAEENDHVFLLERVDDRRVGQGTPRVRLNAN